MRYSKVIVGGIAATSVMTLFMLAAPFFHLPLIDMGAMLGTLFGYSPALGWALHFAIGIFFAFMYVLFVNEWMPVINDFARGTLYGIIVFVASQMVLLTLNVLGFFTWDMAEDMAQTVFMNLLACMLYGWVLGGMMIKGYKAENGLHWEKKDYFWRFRKSRTHEHRPAH